MPFDVRFTDSATREFMALPVRARRAFDSGFELMRDNPYRSVPGVLDVHQLAGGRGLWTFVIGPHRGIYTVLGNTVRFVAFRPRASAYHELEKFPRSA